MQISCKVAWILQFSKQLMIRQSNFNLPQHALFTPPFTKLPTEQILLQWYKTNMWLNLGFQVELKIMFPCHLRWISCPDVLVFFWSELYDSTTLELPEALINAFVTLL